MGTGGAAVVLDGRAVTRGGGVRDGGGAVPRDGAAGLDPGGAIELAAEPLGAEAEPPAPFGSAGGSSSKAGLAASTPPSSIDVPPSWVEERSDTPLGVGVATGMGARRSRSRGIA